MKMKEIITTINQIFLYDGIIPIKIFLDSSERFPGEVFASELLTQSIEIIKDKWDNIKVVIDRNKVENIVISNKAKNEICETYVKPKEGDLKQYDKEIYDFLVGKTRESKKEIILNDFPLRWASGGILSVIKWKKNGKLKAWSPFFFRDIKPYGWNISLGASQRYIKNDGSFSDLNGELNDPGKFILRSFFEETLVLDEEPQKGALHICKQFVLGSSDKNQIEQNQTYSLKHRKCRNRDDGLSFQFSDTEKQNVNAHFLPTNTDLVIIHENLDEPIRINNILIAFNLLELGIEVVKVLGYNLEENDYLQILR